MSRFIYSGEKTKEISFPVGGLGTGCIGLAGNGRLIDWEIFNRPNKGSVNGFSHFAVKAEQDGKVLDARVLNGDLSDTFSGVFGREAFYEGFGWGPLRESMGGMPHFHNHQFHGTFPFAEITFTEEAFPGDVKLTGFNPFIPTNDYDSGIPAAFFEISLTNTTDAPVDYTVVGVLGNVFGSQGFNEIQQNDNSHALHIGTDNMTDAAFKYGDITLATDAEDCSYQEYWYRGRWADALETYWRDFTSPGQFKNRHYDRQENFVNNGWHDRDNGHIAAHVIVNPGDTKTVRFVIAWNFPNCRNYWQDDADERAATAGLQNAWKNYYATLWQDLTASAQYALDEWDRLYAETKLFKDSLFNSDMPEVAIEGVSANLSTLKTPTVQRLEDGTFYGWEGVGVDKGCCEGSCTHVWNYAQALAFLFPALERSMRSANYKYSVDKNGGSHFRIQLPLGMPHDKFRPCADGQLGDVIKTYRDWKISGDTAWLESLWPTVKKTVEYTWNEDNPDQWDPDKTGILQGRQHHTLDMELFGPNAWMTGYYLSALKAASEMAAALGEYDFSQELITVFERGKPWADANLFNGEYYGQLVDLSDRHLLERFDPEQDQASDTYWSEEHQEMKYQVGEGCEIDMVIGQWHANLYGLGEIYDPKQVKKALESTFKYSYKSSMRDEYNPWRLYTIGDDAGLLICSWPEDSHKPAIPLPYAQETQNGYEWAAAIHMIQAGLIDEGLACITAIRNRYDGLHRNPWNEIECGSNYARSMASYSLLNTYSGFKFDMVNGVIGFEPLQPINGSFRCFWSLDSGWGQVLITEETATLDVQYGSLSINKFLLPSQCKGHSLTNVMLNDVTVAHTKDLDYITLEESMTIQAGASLVIKWE